MEDEGPCVWDLNINGQGGCLVICGAKLSCWIVPLPFLYSTDTPFITTCLMIRNSNCNVC